MKHLSAAMLGISSKANQTKFQKTLAVNDYYFGESDFLYPMGHVQLLGKSDKDQVSPDAPFFTPGKMLSEMASHSIDWWFTGEDLPDPDNRVTVLNGHIHQTLKKVEGNVTFHTATSTAFPQPAPGTAPKPGPMKVAPEILPTVLGITEVNYVESTHSLAVVDAKLG